MTVPPVLNGSRNLYFFLVIKYLDMDFDNFLFHNFWTKRAMFLTYIVTNQ